MNEKKILVKIKRGLLLDKMIVGIQNAYKWEMKEGFTFEKYALMWDMWVRIP